MVSANAECSCLDTELLPAYGLFEGQLPPTIMTSLWHGADSRGRNPFALCYYSYPSLGASEEVRKKACEYLSRFGRTREEQTRNYYLWAQTVPKPLWRYFSHLPLSYFADVAVADMMPPLAAAQLLVRLDLYPYFRGANVADLFAGVCGWLMAFMYLPSHYAPRRWIAVDIDPRRLQICKLIARDVGVDVVTIRRDLSTPYVPNNGVDAVVGSPPCHEFTRAKTSSARRVDAGLALVKSYLESVKAINPAAAVMEEATTTTEGQRLVTQLVAQYHFKYGFYDLRDYGAIQYRRRRLIAWRVKP
jgi:predicted RNA methylase